MKYKETYTNIFKNNHGYNSENSISYDKALVFLRDNMSKNKFEKIADIGSGKANLIKKLLPYLKKRH